MDKILWTAENTSRYLGVNATTIQYYLKKGEVRETCAIRKGKSVLIDVYKFCTYIIQSSTKMNRSNKIRENAKIY